jgi:hypothetical protein
MDLKEVRWAAMDWMYMAQDMDHRQAVVNMVMKFRVP